MRTPCTLPLDPPLREVQHVNCYLNRVKVFFFQYSVLTKTNVEINFTTKTGARLDVFK